MPEAGATKNGERNAVHGASTPVHSHQGTGKNLTAKGASNSFPHGQSHGHSRGSCVQIADVRSRREPEHDVGELGPCSILYWCRSDRVIVEHINRAIDAISLSSFHY